MTEDYKEQLLNYITGNLGTTSPTYDEIFKEIIEANRSDWTSYMPSSWDNMKVEGLIKSNTSDTIVLYGGYRKDTTTKGFIILLDTDFKPFKYFDSYSSGTPLRYIQAMNQDEDGTFYLVDDTYYSAGEENDVTTSQKRFVMVNNFTIPTNNIYKINLRISYIFGNDYKNFYCRNIQKNPNSANYAMVGSTFITSTNRYLGIKEIELIINVGMPNEWSYIQTPQTNDYYQTYGDSIISFNNDNKASVKIITSYLGNNGVHSLIKNFNDTGFTYNTLYISSYRSDSIDSRHFNNQCIFINPNEMYFVLTNQQNSWDGSAEDKHIALFYYNFTTSELETIFDKYLGNAIYMVKELICLGINQAKLYISYYVDEDEMNNTANYYVQRYEGIWNPKLVAQDKLFAMQQRGFYVDNDYNLLKIFCYPTNFRSQTWYFPIVKEVYNPTNYNGEEYINTNFLNPKYANIYSNGSIVFSRNLYNISKQNNMMMASVEIPNNYLNNITITQNDLISETNLQMNSNNIAWNKNEYEVVDVNFLNTISVIDEDLNKEYLLCATRINNSITDINDYSNTSCNKVRINYIDTTTKIFPISWSTIDETHKETEFSIYVDKAIKSIDFISNDTKYNS